MTMVSGMNIFQKIGKFTTDRIRNNDTGNAFIPLRPIVTFDSINNSFKTQQYILQSWPELKKEETNWFEIDNGKNSGFHFDEMPFFYMDAQRDILEDTKLRNSYLGKMLSKIEYSTDDIKLIKKKDRIT